MTKKELKHFLNIECNIPLWGRIILSFFPEAHSVYLFRKSQYHASQKGIIHKILKRYYTSKLARTYGILASPYAVIGEGLRFVHPTSVVIGACVQAGKNLHLYQNTTLGGSHLGDVKKGNQPIIGDNCTVFCGSAVLGKITLGNNVTIAANSTLLQDAHDNAICVGSPARIIYK